MSETLLTSQALLTLHDRVWFIAVLLLGLGAAYALFEYSIASKMRRPDWLPGGKSLRARISIGLMVVGVIPAMSLGLFLAERSAHLRQDRVFERLEESAIAAAGAIDQYIDKHRTGVVTAASAASAGGEPDRASLTRWLLLYHEIYPDYLTMLSTDSQGNVLAATSNMSGTLLPVPELVDHNVADRPYFYTPMENGRPFISEVFEGRDLGSDPIVAVSAPMFDANGVRKGIVEGSLNLSAFENFDLNRVQTDGSSMILTDQSSRVIYASEAAELERLMSIVSDPLVTSELNPGEAYEFGMPSGEDQHRYVGVTAMTQNGWTLYLRAPLSQISSQMLSDYLIAIVALAVACVLSMLLSGGIVRRVTRSVTDMNVAISGFSIDGSEEEVATPEDTPTEFRPIFEQMRKRSSALRRAHHRLRNSIAAGSKLQSELTQVVSSKELEIAERTSALEEANRKLNGLSKIDALTGIPNRREYESFVDRVWKVGIRENTPVAIVMMDIDHFKSYNDQLGHLAGDDCLCRVAEALTASALRPMDLVARYGGEEFVAVLALASLDEALVVADRMRDAISVLKEPHPGSRFDRVTISAGVASCVPVQSLVYEDLLRMADEALYQAKAFGRNCVVYKDGETYRKYSPGQQSVKGASVVPLVDYSVTQSKQG